MGKDEEVGQMGVNGETRISGDDGDNGERDESPHAEGGRAWPSCLSIGSFISAYSLLKKQRKFCFFTQELHVKALVDLDN